MASFIDSISVALSCTNVCSILAEISCVVCNSVKISNLLESKKDCPQLTIIVSFDGVTDEQKAAASEAGVQLYTIGEIEVHIRL